MWAFRVVSTLKRVMRKPPRGHCSTKRRRLIASPTAWRTEITTVGGSALKSVTHEAIERPDDLVLGKVKSYKKVRTHRGNLSKGNESRTEFKQAESAA